VIIYSVFKFHQSTTSNTSVDVASHTQTTTIDIQQKNVQISQRKTNFYKLKIKKIKKITIWYEFLPRDAYMHSAHYAVARCSSVCPSHASIVSKRLHI